MLSSRGLFLSFSAQLVTNDQMERVVRRLPESMHQRDIEKQILAPFEDVVTIEIDTG